MQLYTNGSQLFVSGYAMFSIFHDALHFPLFDFGNRMFRQALPEHLFNDVLFPRLSVTDGDHDAACDVATDRAAKYGSGQGLRPVVIVDRPCTSPQCDL